jgi:pyrimidine-nucleoside phosphorylase
MAIVEDGLVIRAVDILRKKRDGLALDAAEVAAFVHAATHGDWPDYQLSAMLMAIWLRGMNTEETAALTGAMTQSGQRLDLRDIPGPKVDKHSTGGVGDSTSLIIAPLVAACGGIVPMMSGRGLGHTGGTLDKLESIPGFRTNLTVDETKAALRTVGAAMIGQTKDIAPADRKLYALRDVTATVESIPLITASIMSKKLAEGIDSLVLDVKFGNGAFMKQFDDAKRLAQTMVKTGNSAGVRTEAMLTDMNVPLGFAVGNAIEVIECIECLKGRGPADLELISVALAARMVRLAGIATSDAEAEKRVRNVLESGQGVEKFRQIIAQQGGNPKVIDDYRLMPMATQHTRIAAERSGYITELAAEPIGRAAMLLGAGRFRAEDAVDPSVGIALRVNIGDAIKTGESIAELFARDESQVGAATALIRSACRIGDEKPIAAPLIRESIV